LDLFDRDVVRKNLAIDTCFAHPPSDELGVLASKVEYDYGLVTNALQEMQTSVPGCASKLLKLSGLRIIGWQ
jgi:hypothetical protein